MLKSLAAIALVIGLPFLAISQESAPRKPLDHVIGTVSAVDSAAHTITMKEDKTGTEYTVQLANTKTLLKVQPGAKDLHSAVRITADDLIAGDRVDVRYDKDESSSPNGIAARSVVLMSARDLQQAHQQEAAAWQHSTAGRVTAVDPATQKLTVRISSLQGPTSISVDASKSTQFTRYSPATPKTPVTSQFSDIQVGDQVRIIGAKSDDNSSIAAEKVYSGAFQTITATISSIASDGKSLTVKDLQTKQSVDVALTDDSVLRKLPPMMAAALARRLNPAAAGGAQGNGAPGQGQGGPPPSAQAPSGAPGAGGMPPGGPGGAGGPGQGQRRGDINAMLERVPQIQTSDLKTGDALVISGAAGSDKSHLTATTIIAGVEPILQSASPRQSQSLGDWGGLDMAAPAQ